MTSRISKGGQSKGHKKTVSHGEQNYQAACACFFDTREDWR